MHAYLIAFLGTGIGGSLRDGVNVDPAALVGAASGTLAINVAGSFIMGLLME